MTTRKTRIRAGAAASAAMLAFALVPTVAHAAPADEGCPAGWTGTAGDCDEPGDIDAGGDGSDEGDGNEETGNDTADVGDTSAPVEQCGAELEPLPEDDTVLPEELEPVDQTVPEEPAIDTPRRRNPDTGVDNSTPRRTVSAAEVAYVMQAMEDFRAQETDRVLSSPQQEESTSINQTGPADLEGLGVSG